ncbi:NAD(P)H-dependent oxidoreductase [Thalassovita aquimarina]|uniref:Nitroreductase family protein n=1 Tax=Thalassovita aquimarina TaxID=2785917 RepID=A0ABS5HUF4_9RHOB|nr:NAD(P)H-dependent oxidoreductase [Thalassovita aquimarina]MBR9652615.1 nitroreductase family protein [Thalassovita aquimarina]
MLKEKLNWRYATKKMDPSKTVPDEKVDAILEAISLAPTSSGLQPFEVIVVKDPDTRAKLSAAAMGQQQLVEGSHVLVFAAWDNYSEERIDSVVAQMAEERGASEMLDDYYSRLKALYLPREERANFEHAVRQAYIALGIALTAAAFEEVDATPMEGFDPEAVDEILGLRARGLRSVLVVPLGYRQEDGDWLVNLKKVRRPRARFVTEVA